MKRKQWVTALKLALVAGLLYFLARKGMLSMEATRRAFDHWDRLGIAVAVLLVTTFLGILRWQMLLRAQDIRLSFLRTTQLAFIGNFFNIALPGAVSGDFVKAFYIAREVQNRRGHVFGSIVFDRVAGLSALVIVSSGTLLFAGPSLWDSRLFDAIRVMVLLSALAVAAFYAYLFLVKEKADPLLRGLQALQGRLEKAGSLTRIYEGIRHYHHRRWVVIQVLLVSIAIHLMVGIAVQQFAIALGETDIALVGLWVVVPLGLLVTAVPIFPAGVGTGHAAFLALFRLLGSQRGADVFTIYALSAFLTGGIGGLVYLRFRGREPKPVLSEDMAT